MYFSTEILRTVPLSYEHMLQLLKYYCTTACFVLIYFKFILKIVIIAIFKMQTFSLSVFSGKTNNSHNCEKLKLCLCSLLCCNYDYYV